MINIRFFAERLDILERIPPVFWPFMSPPAYCLSGRLQILAGCRRAHLCGAQVRAFADWRCWQFQRKHVYR
jgi:hypothetical protein